jgi:hypothetical protein
MEEHGVKGGDFLHSTVMGDESDSITLNKTTWHGMASHSSSQEKEADSNALSL